MLYSWLMGFLDRSNGNQFGGASRGAPKRQREVRVKKIITFCASLVLVLGVSSGASAAFISALGLVTSLTSINAITHFALVDVGLGLGVFEDDYSFSVPGPSSQTTVVAIGFDTNPPGSPLPPDVFISPLTVEIHPSIAFGGSIFSTTIVPLADGSNDTATINALLAGGTSFGLRITGTVIDVTIPFISFPGGSTSYNGSIAVIPLPPAAVLFLSALAGLAGFSRIRRRKAVTTTT